MSDSKVFCTPEGLPAIEEAGELRVLGCLPPKPFCYLPPYAEKYAILPESKWRETDLLDTYQVNVKDQGSTSSCVGHGTATGMELAWQVSGQQRREFSPWHAYALVRRGNGDNGAMVSDAMEAMTAHGIATADMVPPGTIYLHQIKDAAKAAARRFRALTVAKINGWEDMMSALSLNVPVVFGIMVGANFGKLDDEGICPLPDRQLGGHCMVATGALRSRKYGLVPKFVNSWSLRWGLKGKACIRREHLEPLWDAYALLSTNDDPEEVTTDIPVLKAA